MMGKQKVVSGAECQQLWDPFEGSIFRCIHPNGKISILTRDAFQSLYENGHVTLLERGESPSGQGYSEKSLG